MRGRGAAVVAANVAASVASKVNGGSMLKVTDDPPKNKEKVETRKVPGDTGDNDRGSSRRRSASRFAGMGGGKGALRLRFTACHC